ncbi:MAG: PDGLE domain-containing protein [Methermicoccaceae archaeon]
MESWMKRAWLVIAIFVVLVPLGILATWNYGDAWGEWGEVHTSGGVWTPQEYGGGAPLPDYNVPGWEDSMLMSSVGYWLSAILGILMTVLLTLGVVKAVEIWRGS